MKILTINTSDQIGGAARVAWNLHRAYLKRKIDSRMLVGFQSVPDESIGTLNHRGSLNSWSRTLLNAADNLEGYKVRGSWRLSRILRAISQPAKYVNRMRGIEDFDFRATWQILNQPWKPDLIHCHNLHGDYFDLRSLSWLSRQLPVIMTLHDAWLLSGHCAHSLDCERWKTGCGECPYPQIYPEVKRDSTSFNWKRKKEIYKDSTLYISAPCTWMINKIEQSILHGAIIETRLIPYGVDTDFFQPGDRITVRKSLDLPEDAWISISVAHHMRFNPFKGFSTLRSAFVEFSKLRPTQKSILLIVGDSSEPERITENAEIRYYGFKSALQDVLPYYQASNVYLQTSVADTFPNTVLEALACGIPVIAASVGGIPEQIRNHETGILVPPGQSSAIVQAMDQLVQNRELYLSISRKARQSAEVDFHSEKQIQSYINWYQEILNRHRMTA